MTSTLGSDAVKPAAEQVRAVQVFTGCGMMEVAKAIRLCQGDLRLACGYLHYVGAAVNLRGRDPTVWALSCAEGYAADLRIDDLGSIYREGTRTLGDPSP